MSKTETTTNNQTQATATSKTAEEVQPAKTTTTDYPIYTWEDLKKRRTRSKVALVGFASSSFGDTPWGNDEFDIWVINDLGRQVPRWDRLVDVHSKEHLIGGKWEREGGRVVHGKDHWEYMTKCPPPGDPKFNPIIMLQHYDEIPASVAVPVKQMTAQLYTQGEGQYFTCGPAYMMAMAICEGYTDIHLYGIDLVMTKEYFYERPCMEYLTGLARGKGINVYVPPQCALCKASYVYGFSYIPASEGLDKLREYIEALKIKLQNGVQHKHGEFSATHHAIAMLEEFAQWLREQPADSTKEVILASWLEHSKKVRVKIANKQVQSAQELGRIQGTLQTADSVVTWCDHIKRGGELKA